ncbi:MAG TPA: hypothetical protein VHP81_11350 [Lachnospiraceae bacterium]|nr:hypothetical protein [Lachnospiraceae bacterium]
MLLFHICSTLIIIIYICLTCRYRRKELIELYDSKKMKLFFLYPSCLFLLDKCNLIERALTKLHETFLLLYVRKDARKEYILYCCEKLSSIILILSVINLFSIYLILSSNKGILIDNYYIERPEYGDEGKVVNLEANVDNLPLQIKVQVGERRFEDGTKINEIIKQSALAVESSILGANKSFNCINSKLNLVKSVPDFNVKVTWELDERGIIKWNGDVENEGIQASGEVVTLIAHLNYYGVEAQHTINLRVMPKEYSTEQLIANSLQEVIKQRDSESLSNEVLELPRTLDGKEIWYKENKKATSEMIFFLGIISAILIAFLGFTQLDRKRKDREMELMMSYPDMINKVILLLGAGMTIRNVWGKISGEYKEKLERRKEGERYVYEEMLVTWIEMCNGRSELDAYDAFGKRVKLKPYLKFSSLLVQNAKKGTTDLLHSLEY